MEGFMYDVIENNSRDKSVELEVMHKTFENLDLMPPYSGDSYGVTVKPGSRQVIIKKQVSLLDVTDVSFGMRKRIF